jgi:hypothetical protein
MKSKIFPVIAFLFFIFLACPKKEIPYLSHVYGWLRLSTAESLGVNGILLQISDLNPEQPDRFRIREVTTQIRDARDGYFEMDSVCYGTSGYMSGDIVTIYCDSLKNPGWKTQWWNPSLKSEVDTIIIFIVHH